MTKYSPLQGQGFGARLAALRGAAGFTQHQLDDQLGISRGRIAYCEAESDHPRPTCSQTSRALNVDEESSGSAQMLGKAVFHLEDFFAVLWTCTDGKGSSQLR